MRGLIDQVFVFVLKDKYKAINNLFEGVVFFLELFFQSVLLDDHLKILF